jgi:hypothetical protein
MLLEATLLSGTSREKLVGLWVDSNISKSKVFRYVRESCVLFTVEQHMLANILPPLTLQPDAVDLWADYIMQQEGKSIKFAHFEQMTERWPPDAAHQLHHLSDSFVGSCKKAMDCLSEPKRRGREQGVGFPNTIHDAILAVINCHGVAVKAAINRNFLTIVHLTRAEVYRLMMNVWVGNHYERCCVYEPSVVKPRDHVPIVRVDPEENKRKPKK